MNNLTSMTMFSESTEFKQAVYEQSQESSLEPATSFLFSVQYVLENRTKQTKFCKNYNEVLKLVRSKWVTCVSVTNSNVKAFRGDPVQVSYELWEYCLGKRVYDTSWFWAVYAGSSEQLECVVVNQKDLAKARRSLLLDSNGNVVSLGVQDLKVFCTERFSIVRGATSSVAINNRYKMYRRFARVIAYKDVERSFEAFELLYRNDLSKIVGMTAPLTLRVRTGRGDSEYNVKTMSGTTADILRHLWEISTGSAAIFDSGKSLVWRSAKCDGCVDLRGLSSYLDEDNVVMRYAPYIPN